MQSLHWQASQSCCTDASYWFLQVTIDNMLFQDRGVTLLRTVQMLPALTDLCIDYQGEVSKLRAPVSDSNGLPRCKELAELRSRSLTDLKVWMFGGPSQGNAAAQRPARAAQLPAHYGAHDARQHAH